MLHDSPSKFFKRIKICCCCWHVLAVTKCTLRAPFTPHPSFLAQLLILNLAVAPAAVTAAAAVEPTSCVFCFFLLSFKFSAGPTVDGRLQASGHPSACVSIFASVIDGRRKSHCHCHCHRRKPRQDKTLIDGLNVRLSTGARNGTDGAVRGKWQLEIQIP